MPFTISGTITGNGQFDPALPLLINDGDSVTINFNADPGYKVSEVFIDGYPIGAVTSFDFNEVQSDYHIDAIFVQSSVPSHIITVNSTPYGIISPSGFVEVEDGQDQVFNITPIEGYTHTNWVVDSVNEPASPTYTFLNVIGNHTISAIFEKDIVYQPTVKLLKMEELTIKRRNYSAGSYNGAGYRERGPLNRTFTVYGNVQPGQTQSGLLQAVGEQVRQEFDYDLINKSWKIFTREKIEKKDIFVLDDGEYEVLDVDDWSRYNLRSINFRSMCRKIKSRQVP